MINILDKANCTGCSACFSICPKQCISMTKDEEGFNYPVIDKNLCINCNLCENICPLINKKEINTETKTYAMMNKDSRTREESTSGGVFSLLANYILDLNGYVIGVAYDDNFVVKHIIVNNKDDLYKLRGAKYSQSELGNIFKQTKELLDKNKYVLFSGTPCQIVGLKSYLRKDYKKLITVDLICHGVPSPLAWNKYLEYRYKQDNKGKKASHINLRSKITGWSNYSYSIVFDYDDYRYTSINYEDPFMKAFVGNLCLRPSCYDCHFKGLERISDFTLGDYWGIWKQIPEMDDNCGTSVVFIHSYLGKEIFDQIKDKVIYQEVDSKTSIEMNPSMIESSFSNDDRDKFMNDLENSDFDYLIEKYDLKPKNLQVSLLKRIAGKIKRFI